MGARAGQDFETYFERVEPRLRAALTAGFGAEPGREAAAEALAWGWANWDRLQTMDNPDGYLYRVARNEAIRQRTRDLRLPPDDFVGHQAQGWSDPEFEPALAQLLADLPTQQRTCLWLVHGLGHTLADTADLLGCSRSTVAAHVRRALVVLRNRMEICHD